MDFKKLLIFVALSAALLYGWLHIFPQSSTTPVQENGSVAPKMAATADLVKSASALTALPSASRVRVATDVLKAEIDTIGGDLRALHFLRHRSAINTQEPFELLSDKGGHIHVAQTGLVSADPKLAGLPTHRTSFKAQQYDYDLKNKDQLEVRLTAPVTHGIYVDKVYIFRRGSYVIDIRYDIYNGTDNPLSLTAYYQLLRGNQVPEGESSFVSTFTGPGIYTEKDKFQKFDFDDLDDGDPEHPQKTKDGWIGMIEHYFMSAWIFKPNHKKSACYESCYLDIASLPGNLYSARALTTLSAIAPEQKKSLEMALFVGPQEYNLLTKTAPGLELSKDYGWVHIFAAPLFWLLMQLERLVMNWGWSIVLLTVIIKAVFYPLTGASYRSMAKMRALAPKLQDIKERYGEDRLKFQQATMALYKTEKINPLGGCLPMLVQIPVFFGLYSALLASVELRQSPWIGWINDLSCPDPFFILPLVMAITMVGQTFLNPAPADPVQAKMMKIMPVIFSVMFFFLPSGLVLYWLVSNILSILQQWYVNNQNKPNESR